MPANRSPSRGAGNEGGSEISPGPGVIESGPGCIPGSQLIVGRGTMVLQAGSRQTLAACAGQPRHLVVTGCIADQHNAGR